MSAHEIFFLEDDSDLRFLYKSFAESQGHVADTASSFGEMMGKSKNALRSHAIFLDIELGRDEASGLDAYEWLLSSHFKGRIYFLTAHGQGHPIVERTNGHVEVLAKPIAPEILSERMSGGVQ